MPHSREACILALALLVLALAGCVTAETPELTLPVITEEPGASPPPYPPPAPTITPLPTGGTSYPPPGQPTPYPPAPTRTPTATPWGIGNLPPLPTYPPPGPFSGMKILYDVYAQGLWVVDVDGSGDERFPALVGEFNGGFWYHVSPNGEKILYSVWNDFDWDLNSIWVSDSDGSNLQQLVAAAGGGYPHDAIWSPDGGQIAYGWWFQFEPNKVPESELWVMDADGSNRRLLFSDPEIFHLAGYGPGYYWAHNGYIYFVNIHEQLFALNPNDGSLYLLMYGADPLGIFFSVSPDGLHAIQGNQTLAAGFQTVQVSGLDAIWSDDGAYLLHWDEQGMWLHEVATGAETTLMEFENDTIPMIHGLSPDNRYVAYETDEGLFVLDVLDLPAGAQLVVPDPRVPETGRSAIRFERWIPVP